MCASVLLIGPVLDRLANWACDEATEQPRLSLSCTTYGQHTTPRLIATTQIHRMAQTRCWAAAPGP